MAATVRIENIFKGIDGTRYKVQIWDEDYASATITNFEDNGFVITWEGEGDILLNPVKPSRCKYILVDNDSSDFTAFKNDLATANEDEFKLVIYKDVGGNFVIHWAGIIVSDMVEWANYSPNRDFEITAIDGLNRMGEIEFDKINLSPYTTASQTFIKVIFDCLSYSGLAKFWTASTKPYITCNNDWYDTQQALVVSSRILEAVRINRGLLFDKEIKVYYKDPNTRARPVAYTPLTPGDDNPPKRVLDVLTGILRLLGCRLILSDGTYNIQQISNFTADTYTVAKYNYLGVYDGTATFTAKVSTSSSFGVLAGGKFGYFPAINRASATVIPSEKINSTTDIKQFLNKNNLSITQTFKIGTIYGGVGTNLKLELELEGLIDKWDSALSGAYFVTATIKLRCDNYRVLQSVTQTKNSWTTNAADTISVLLTNNLYTTSLGFIVRTEEIPFTVKTGCEIDLTITLNRANTSVAFPDVTVLNFYFKRLLVRLVSITDIPNITKYIVNNPSYPSNSIDVDLGELHVEDTGFISSFNCLEVQTTETSGVWVKSNIWEAGYTADNTLVQTILKEMIAVQRTTVKKYMGLLYGCNPYSSCNSIGYDGVKWVFHSGTFDSKNETFDGVWFAISRDKSSIDDATTRKNDDPTKGLAKPTQRGPSDGVSISNIGLRFSKGIVYDYIAQGDTITDIGVYSLTSGHIKKGDNIQIINAVTLEIIDTLVCDADTTTGDSAITVVSHSVASQINTTYLADLNPKEVLSSDVLRGIDIQVEESTKIGIGYSYFIEQVLKARTTGSATTELTVNGGAATLLNIILIPVDSAVSCMFYFTAKKANSTDCAMFTRQCLIVNDSGSTALEGTVQTIGTDILSAGLTGISVTITANDSGDALKVEVVGLAVTNINWSAKCDLTISVYA